MTNELYENVVAHVADEAVSGLIIEVEHEPLSGKAAPVAPPTYAPEQKGDKSPNHAVTEGAFVPARAADGWFNGIQGSANSGTPRLEKRVVLNSYPAQSGRAETALWRQQERLGVQLPGIVIDGEQSVRAGQGAELVDVLTRSFSSWELAHRQVDAWIKFASADGKQQISQQEITEVGDEVAADNLRSLLAAASAERGDLLYRYFPNAATYGFWASTGFAARHRLARAYSSEIVGYAAHGVAVGATKLDPTGGALNTSFVNVGPGRALSVAATGKKGQKPSLLGFGQVPAKPEVRRFVCELILEQSSISLQLLRRLRFGDRAQQNAATAVFILLALAGHTLAAEDGFLRSGCALVAVDERWGWRLRGQRTPQALDVVGIDDVAAALQVAVAHAADTGLHFAAPIELQFSAAEVDIIRQRVASDEAKVQSEDD